MGDSKIYFSFFYLSMSIVLLMVQGMQGISIFSVYPDFLLLLTIIFSFSRDSFKGEIFGFIFGILLDLMSGALFGLNAFIFTLTGACTDSFRKIAKLPNLIVFIFYIIFVTAIKYVLYHIFFFIYQGTLLVDFYFILKIPSEIFINLIFGIILYIICARFDVRDNYEWF
ncbi:MAG: rod shape-determining protein MreD [Brevinema sp.]